MRGVRASYRLLMSLACAYGLYAGIRGGAVGEQMLYYTYQSNALCLAMLLLCGLTDAFGVRMKRRWPRVIKGAVTMAIVVTGLVYHFLLRPQWGMAWTPENVILHYTTPIYAFGDALAFDERGAFRFSDALWWLGIPYAYLAFAMTYSALGGRFGQSKYPYFFLNVNTLGVLGVAKWVALITVAFLALSEAFIALNRLGGKRITSRAA